MKIAEVSRDLFPEWKRLRQRLFQGLEESWHDREMELIFDAPDATCFLGFADSGEAVALLELSLRNYVDGCLGGPVGYVEGIYLVPEFRRQGHGRMLTSFAADWFISQGCRDMAADSELENTSAQEFLSRIGFQETYRIVQFKRSLNGPDKQSHPPAQGPA